MAAKSGTPTKIRKIESTEGTSEADESNDFDVETQKALEEIDACQNDIDALNEKASEEILQTEQKYNKLRKPFFQKRSKLIDNIPNFWVTAFVNHPQISAILDEDEEECLQYMTKVDIEEFDDIKSGYKIALSFKINPFFKNNELVKEFHLGTSGELSEPSSESTPIDWKAGKNLVKAAEDAQKSKGGKHKLAPLSRTFFQWFLDNSEPSVDDIAEVLKDDMWPNPLQYFLASEMDDTENGLNTSDEDDEDELEESVEVTGEEEDLDDIDEEDDDEGEDEDDE